MNVPEEYSFDIDESVFDLINHEIGQEAAKIVMAGLVSEAKKNPLYDSLVSTKSFHELKMRLSLMGVDLEFGEGEFDELREDELDWLHFCSAAADAISKGERSIGIDGSRGKGLLAEYFRQFGV